MSPFRLFIISLAAIQSITCLADEITLLDGSHIKGKLISATGENIIFKTGFAGEITVNTRKVKTLNTVSTVTVKTTAGDIIKDHRFASQNNQVTLSNEVQTQTLNLADVALINPQPWQLGDGYQWSGKASTALQLKRGNSKSDEFDGVAESIWKSIDDRYTVRANFELDEAGDEETKNNWKLQGKYDHTLDESENFIGFQTSFEQDKFADLDLRTIAGPYIGRKLLSNNYLSLHGEIGIVYVDEIHNIAPDKDFVGSNWELRLTSDWFGGGTVFYINQDGVINFDAADEILFNTRIGITMPLVLSINAGFEIKYEYDGGAVDNIDKLDETYNLKLGYSW